MNSLYYQELNYLNSIGVLVITHEVLSAPIITSWNFCKNILDFTKSIKNLKFSHYCGNFCRKRQFYWCDLKIWFVPIIPNYYPTFSKWSSFDAFEKLNCPYYKEVKFHKNILNYMRSLENLSWSHYGEG